MQIAGWQDEIETPNWDEYNILGDDGEMADLLMPRTVAASATEDAAARKLDAAFNDVLDDAERQPAPTRASELERFDRMVLARVPRWFEHTDLFDRNLRRAEALRARWAAAIAAASLSPR